jgi:hypothetical protein
MTSNSDSARYFIPLTAQTSRIYTGGNNGHRSVVGQMANGELTQGVRLCFQGAASDNNNCGFINFVDTPVVDENNHTITHTWCIDFPSLPGDSGGPVYRVNANQSATAAGVENSSASISGVNSACFSSISWVLADLNLLLVTGLL